MTQVLLAGNCITSCHCSQLLVSVKLHLVSCFLGLSRNFSFDLIHCSIGLICMKYNIPVNALQVF